MKTTNAVTFKFPRKSRDTVVTPANARSICSVAKQVWQTCVAVCQVPLGTTRWRCCMERVGMRTFWICTVRNKQAKVNGQHTYGWGNTATGQATRRTDSCTLIASISAVEEHNNAPHAVRTEHTQIFMPHIAATY